MLNPLGIAFGLLPLKLSPLPILINPPVKLDLYSLIVADRLMSIGYSFEVIERLISPDTSD